MEKITAAVQRISRENAELRRQLEAATVEKREAEENMDATRMAHKQSVSSYQQSRDGGGGGGGGSGTSAQRVEELESVISSLTEYLNAKEMQIDTLRQVNRVLADDIDERPCCGAAARQC